MSETELEPAAKVEPTVAYLQKLGSGHLDLIFEASQWVFDVDREAAMHIFVADLEEVEALPRHAVLRHLRAVGADAERAYLEHIIRALGEDGPEFHERLIELYLADVGGADAPSTDSEAYRKLLGFLDASTQYRADRLLQRLPDGSMYEVRAVLLGRLGQHEGALGIYVDRLGDYATAEAYCARVYEAAPDDAGSIYLALLRIYLRPAGKGAVRFEPALALLARHGARIDLAAALDLLPPAVGVHDVGAFVCKSLRRTTERRRDSLVVRDVFHAATDRLDLELVGLEERRVKITDSRLCPQCHKRLGNSVIAILQPECVPLTSLCFHVLTFRDSGDAVHFACIPR